jgi:hypothetical protein
MVNHLGKDGTVKVGGNTVAEIRSASISETADTVEDTVIGDSWKTRQVTQKDWKATLEVFWDETDTAQNALTIGASVTFATYPEGAGSGATYCTGTGLVTSREIKYTHNGLVEATLQVDGTGALSWTTV